jgi:hypothetical protein
MKKALHRVEERKEHHTYKKRRKADWIGYILRSNCRIIHANKETYRGGEDEDEDVRSYCMILSRRKPT